MKGYNTMSESLGPVVVQGVSGNMTASRLGHSTNPEANYLLLEWHHGIRDYVHQIGHLLGLLDEHQRPDRNQYLELVCARVRCTNKLNKNYELLKCVPGDCNPNTSTLYGCNFSACNL
ncbi:hypothetical protein BROUX41_000373 [Berkeleyomyces rouxiae]